MEGKKVIVVGPNPTAISAAEIAAKTGDRVEDIIIVDRLSEGIAKSELSKVAESYDKILKDTELELKNFAYHIPGEFNEPIISKHQGAAGKNKGGNKKRRNKIAKQSRRNNR